MIVVSSALALSLAADPSAGLPLIGWHNLVTYSNMVATSGDDDYPVTNLANPNTTLIWRSLITGNQYITITVNDEVDYLAIARHNFGTGGIISSIEGLTADEEAEWTELVAEQTVEDDSPILYRWTLGAYAEIRIYMQPDATLPEIGVMYLGRLLVCERGVQAGHVPFPYGRRREYVGNWSTAGEFLGKIQIGEKLQSSVEFHYFTPAWYRLNFDAFLEAAVPFFICVDPERYPEEVAFASFTNDAEPVTSHLAGYINVSLQMDAIAL